jgi:hypothetical protein
VRRRAAATASVLLLVTSGCGYSNLAFRQDDRLSFVTPEDRAEVTLPLTVRWTVEDFEVGPDGGSFAVFVDRAPQPPGKPLEWLARDDDSCRVADGCPDDDWYAMRDVYPTTEEELTIDQLPSRSDDRRELHEVTVVLLDEDGRRVGETGWTREFEVVRD